MAIAARTQEAETVPVALALLLRLNVARMLLGAASLAWLVDAVIEDPAPLVMAVGIAPLAWIALEAVWRLTDHSPQR